jgi:hypothetical protein
LGQERTSSGYLPMSALPPKADIGTQPCDVRFVPKADIPTSLDHLVRPREQRRRHGEVKRFCSRRPLGSIRVTRVGRGGGGGQEERENTGLQEASVRHCLLLPSKRIGRTKVRSVSGTAAGGGGNGAARVIRESASASSTAEPELLMI